MQLKSHREPDGHLDNETEEPSGKPSKSDFARVSYRYPEGKTFAAPLFLGIASLILGMCGQVLPLVGAGLGVFALVTRSLSRVPREYHKSPRLATAFAILGILASVALAVPIPQPGTISLTVDAPEWKDSYGDVTVQVTGKTAQGEDFHDSLEVEPNSPYTLDGYETGSYTFSIDENDLEKDDALYEPQLDGYGCELELDRDVELTISLARTPLEGTLSLSLDGSTVPADASTATISIVGTTRNGSPFEDSFSMAFGDARDLSDYPIGDYTLSVSPSTFTLNDTVYVINGCTFTYSKQDDTSLALSATVDEEATQELAEQREAERAAAEAEAQRQREASAQQAEITVYITDTGSKYHREGCRYLRQSCHAISLSSAKASGYTACSVCKPPQ